MLLYGVNLGSDPDVYAFWHSSQAKDPGVNLSGYNSTDADRALETARIKADEQVRQGKYEAFLKAWNADTPAAVLYWLEVVGHDDFDKGVDEGRIRSGLAVLFPGITVNTLPVVQAGPQETITDDEYEHLPTRQSHRRRAS